jgi:hypothetical protein
MKTTAVGIQGLEFTIPRAVLQNSLRNADAIAFDPRNPNAGCGCLGLPRVSPPPHLDHR